MSSEPLLDLIPIMKREQDGAIITQFDYPTCERLGLIKMDFLGLRNLTVLDDAARATSPPTAGETVVLEDLSLDDPTTYELLARGDTLGRVPARRRADARAAALDAAGQLRGHLGRRRAVPAGPDGRQLAQRVRGPQEQPQARRADPPGTGGAARRDPRRHLRSHRLPGTGHGDRAARRRVLAGRRRPAAAGDGQEEEGRAGRPVRDLLGRHAGARVTRGRAIKTLWDILLPFSDYAFNKAHSAAYGLVVLLDRLPQGELPRRVHGRRC